MSRRVYYVLGYLAVTTLLTLGGLALRPPDAPPWESGEERPAGGGPDDQFPNEPAGVEEELSNAERQGSRPAFA